MNTSRSIRLMPSLLFLLSLPLFLIFIFSNPIPAAASPASSFGSAIQENRALINNDSIRLFDTFDNEAEALANFKAANAPFLDLASSMGLPELSTKTAEEYKQFAVSVNADSEVCEFLDIFENTEINQRTMLLVDHLDASSAGDIAPSSLALNGIMLPINNTVPSDPNFSILRAPNINLAAAQSYAEKYAVNYNQKYGYERSNLGFSPADCTNFASQILHAGGIQMAMYSNQAMGWWWRAIGNRSITWVGAAAFAQYMGSWFQSTYWNTFKAGIMAGDFIAYDRGDDGDIDHMAFIHSKNNGFVRIAQHSSDYIKWDDATGWPGLQNGTCRFYRIRR